MSLLLFLQTAGLILVPYLFCVVFYRLYLHPLRGFPGPWLAAATGYYQTYYEVWRDGEFVPHVKELHRIYGPIIRVSPNELHFSDPAAYTTIYSSNPHLTKDPFYYGGFGESETAFSLTNPKEAKNRREIISPLFSRRSVLGYDHVIQDKIETLVTLLLPAVETGKPVNLLLALHSLTLDVLSSICFSSSFDVLHAPQFSHPILIGIESTIPFVFTTKHFPILHRLKRSPRWLLPKKMVGLGMLRNRLEKEIEDIVQNAELNGEPIERRGRDGDENVYNLMLSPKGNSVLTRKVILDEAVNLCFAGTDTTGNTLTVGIFHILRDPSIQSKLLQELVGVWPDKDVRVRYEVLEGLPYLTAVIKESLRLSLGVPETLPRVANQDMLINGVHIPAGTKIGMSSYIVHTNAEIFPDPDRFNPERWLRVDQGGKNLDSFLVTFSKGRRSCVGINLAWCELYLTIAHLFRKLDMRIHRTTPEDMKIRYHNLPVYRGYPLHVVVTERKE